MNIKIYFNSNYIELTDTNGPPVAGENYELIEANKVNQHIIKEIVETFTQKKEPKNFRIFTNFGKEIFKELKKQFVYIEAAGGFIEKQGEFLFIYRNGLWDLPKGKLEKNENEKDGAVRECEEECGVKQLHIQHQLKPSYHIYNYKGRFALKKTYWFYMTTSFNDDLKPQLEENITEVKWFSKTEISEKVMPHTYTTIRAVISNALNL